MFLSTVFVVFAAIFATVKGDTPANCTFEDVQGTWVFYVGENDHDNTLKCDSSFKVVTQIRVHLLFPDVVLDDNYNRGFWTMIYNQGFEVVLNGKKYFAFSYYDGSGSKAVSYCDQTLLGWSHDADISRNWACYYGIKENSIQASKISNAPLLSSSVYDRPYKLNKDFLAAIKEKQSSWFPTVYPEYETLTLRELMSRAGGPKTYNSPLPKPIKTDELMASAELPSDLDWRNVGGIDYVSPVRDQGQCGSCYAFSAMAMFEARSRIQSNHTTSYVLSAQDIVSCSEYSQGCEGGFPYLISKYANDFGLVEESCYPYLGKDTQCAESASCKRHYGLNDYHYVGGFYGACNEPLMRLELVQNGPFSVAFEATSDFVHYKGGIYVNPERMTAWHISFDARPVTGPNFNSLPAPRYETKLRCCQNYL